MIERNWQSSLPDKKRSAARFAGPQRFDSSISLTGFNESRRVFVC